MPEGGGDRMLVLRLLGEGRITTEQSVTLLKALAEAGAGRLPDPGAEERLRVVRMLETGRLAVDEVTTVLRALADAGMGRLPDEGSEERASVLRMLEEGRIGVQDATQLLQALRETSGSRHGPGFSFSFSKGWGGDRPWKAFRLRPPRPPWPPEPERWERAARRAAERAQRAAEYWSQHAEEIAERVGRAAEQVGDQMGRVLAGVPDVVERMAKAGWGNWGPGYRFEEVVEGELPADGEAALDVEGWNGAVTLRPVDGGRVRLVLRKTVHAPTEEAAREIAAAVDAGVDAEARRVHVGRRRAGGAWAGGLSVEAYLPRALLWSGEVRTGNGPAEVEGLQLRGLRVETSNGAVRLRDCAGEDVTATTSNGRIEVRGTLRGRLDLRTSNGAVQVEPGRVGEGEARVDATTSNGSIEVRLPAGIAVDLNATTSNGRFDLSGLGPDGPDLGQQKGFGRSEVRWRSPDWDQAATRLRLQLRTSNGAVRVV